MRHAALPALRLHDARRVEERRCEADPLALPSRPQAGEDGRPPRGAGGATVVVERLDGAPELLARLTAQGIAPGVRLHVLQRLPTFVIEVGETTIGLEHAVAAAIVVRPA
jgi:Fe2+ transport system protein FeoA